MKKNKLRLTELEVKSFISEVKERDVKGGGYYSVLICDTDWDICRGSYIC